MTEAETVREEALAILADAGPLTTARLTAALLRAGLEVDTGKVNALMVSEAFAGYVKTGSTEEGGARVPLWHLAAHTVLTWGKPPRAEDPAVRAEYYGGGIPGAYAPNMSQEWMARWKAVMRGTRQPPLRVEVRKSVGITRGGSCQVKLIAAEDGSVVMSMNGTADFGAGEWAELAQAVSEARAAMARYRARGMRQTPAEGMRALSGDLSLVAVRDDGTEFPVNPDVGPDGSWAYTVPGGVCMVAGRAVTPGDTVSGQMGVSLT